MQETPLESKVYAVKRMYCSDKMRFLFFFLFLPEQDMLIGTVFGCGEAIDMVRRKMIFLPRRGSAIPQ